MSRILVVDDEEDIQLLVRTILFDHDVTSASSGAEALSLVEANEFDVVLLDIMMPGMDGFTVLRQLRSRGTLTTARVVMLTAQGAEAYHQRAFEAGADAYLTKPFHPKDVVACVETVLSRTPQERETARLDGAERAKLLGQIERRFS